MRITTAERKKNDYREWDKKRPWDKTGKTTAKISYFSERLFCLFYIVQL